VRFSCAASLNGAPYFESVLLQRLPNAAAAFSPQSSYTRSTTQRFTPTRDKPNSCTLPRRASNYNHVHDAVAMNFQEAASVVWHLDAIDATRRRWSSQSRQHLLSQRQFGAYPPQYHSRTTFLSTIIGPKSTRPIS
jgi:hypothetical protein